MVTHVVGKVNVVTASAYKPGDEDGARGGQPFVVVDGGTSEVGPGDVIVTDADGKKRVRSERDIDAGYTPVAEVAEKLEISSVAKTAEAARLLKAVEATEAQKTAEAARLLKAVEATEAAKAEVETAKAALAVEAQKAARAEVKTVKAEAQKAVEAAKAETEKAKAAYAADEEAAEEAAEAQTANAAFAAMVRELKTDVGAIKELAERRLVFIKAVQPFLANSRARAAEGLSARAEELLSVV